MEWSNKNQLNSFNSAKGLAYYGRYKNIVAWMDGKADLMPPVECNLDPIAECNLSCKFCITQRYLKSHRDEVGVMRALPTEYMERLVDFLAEWGVKGLCISGGGEPTLHKGAWGLTSRAVAHGMDAAWFTNATNITDELAFELAQCRWVAMSIDAGDRETYQTVKGEDLFTKAMQGIKTLVKWREKTGSKVDLCFKFAIMPDNYQTIYTACLLAKELGVQDFHARPVDFERNDIEGARKLSLDVDYIKEQFAKCHAEETDDFHVYTVTHKFDENFNVKHDFTQCLATPLVIPILTDGNAYLCVDRKMEKDYILGSAYPNPETILEWWGSDKHRELIKSVDISKCSRCTWGQYSKQIEQIVLSDKMCLNFP